MRHRSTPFLIVLAVVALIVALGAAFLHDGLSSRATPTRMEAMVARNARHMAIPSNARAMLNPLLDSAEDLREARLHFADHCAICHANDGSGDTTIGNGLYPKPPDLRRPETQNLADGEIYWIISNGVRFTGMPAFPDAENHGSNGNGGGTGMENWRLVHFIRHLPHLSTAERLEMERYNPKGPDDRKKSRRMIS